jgi:hypothetical protein
MLDGKPRWGHKTPGYGQFVPEVLGLLPEADLGYET